MGWSTEDSRELCPRAGICVAFVIVCVREPRATGQGWSPTKVRVEVSGVDRCDVSGGDGCDGVQRTHER